MSFSICGFVRDNVTSIGIDNIWITLMDPSGSYMQVKTDEKGSYTFDNLECMGMYIVYENVEYSNIFPPIKFTQPIGYNQSTSTRILSIDVGEDMDETVIITDFEHISIENSNIKYNPHITVSQDVDLQYISINESVTYTLVCTNDGNIELDNIMISNVLSTQMEYVKKSLIINNRSVENQDVLKGIDIGRLRIGETRIIKFQAKILESGIIESYAIATYTYKVDTCNTPKSTNHRSNISTVNVYNTNVKLEKYHNKNNVILGDEVEYTIRIDNISDVDIYNILFTDEVEKYMFLIPGTFNIDGNIINSVDLHQGILIPNLKKEKSIVIKFKTKVCNSLYSSKIVENAKIKYSYALPDGSYGQNESTPQNKYENIITISNSNFKQLSIQEYLRIPNQKPDIHDINSVNAEMNIVNYHIVKTIQNTSIEGQINTGYKLIVYGTLNIVISYASCDTWSSVYSAQYDIPFSSFIVLPMDYKISTKVEIDGKIENISYENIDCKTFFVNAIVLLNAKVIG